MTVYESWDPEGIEALVAIIAGEGYFTDLPTEMYDHIVERSEMPYDVQKARSMTPDQWLSENFDEKEILSWFGING